MSDEKKEADRQARLAAALRANLARRKAMARAAGRADRVVSVDGERERED